MPGVGIIELADGSRCILDLCDFERLSKFAWQRNSRGYVWRAVRDGNRYRSLLISREIMDIPIGSKTLVDHINGDKLDNRRANLRTCTQRENMQNRRKRAGTSSRYKGVHHRKDSGKWMAHIKADDGLKYLGQFDTELEAAKAYDKAARQYHGEFAKLNGVA